MTCRRFPERCHFQPAILVPPPVIRLFGDTQAPTHLDNSLALAQGDFGLTQLGNDLLDGILGARHGALLVAARPNIGSGPV
jgi:hypothetical protein